MTIGQQRASVSQTSLNDRSPKIFVASLSAACAGELVQDALILLREMVALLSCPLERTRITTRSFMGVCRSLLGGQFGSHQREGKGTSAMRHERHRLPEKIRRHVYGIDDFGRERGDFHPDTLQDFLMQGHWGHSTGSGGTLMGVWPISSS
jgi:hypothetical protein